MTLSRELASTFCHGTTDSDGFVGRRLRLIEKIRRLRLIEKIVYTTNVLKQFTTLRSS